MDRLSIIDKLKTVYYKSRITQFSGSPIPIGEAEAIRTARYASAYDNSLISYETWCEGIGIKDIEKEKEQIDTDIEWKKIHGIPIFNGTKK